MRRSIVNGDEPVIEGYNVCESCGQDKKDCDYAVVDGRDEAIIICDYCFEQITKDQEVCHV